MDATLLPQTDREEMYYVGMKKLMGEVEELKKELKRVESVNNNYATALNSLRINMNKNESLYKLIVELVQENRELREKLEY